MLLGFFKVRVRAAVPWATMYAGEKLLSRVGGGTGGSGVTLSVALADWTLPPPPVRNAPTGSVLMYVHCLTLGPAMQGAVTATVTVQVLYAGIEPVDKVTLELPLVASSDPPHVVFAVPDTTMPLGISSVRGAVMLVTFPEVLYNVMVRVEGEPATTSVGAKFLCNSGVPAAADTINVALADAELLPSLVCNAPTGNKLMNVH